MKRILFLMVAALIAFGVSTTVNAQGSQLTPEKKKDIEKTAKKSAKRYEKEGYKYIGAGTLEGALTRFMMITQDPSTNVVESTIFIEGVKSVARGESRALSEAEVQFQRSVKQAIKAEINTNAGGASKEDEVEAQVDIVARRLAGELEGDIIKHFTIYRKSATGDGVDVTVFISKPNLTSPNNRHKIKRALDDNLEMSKKIREHLDEPDKK